MGIEAAILGLGAAGLADSVGTGLMSAGYQSKVAKANAKLANYQAADALARGSVAEFRHRQQVGKLVGAQRAGYGAQGIDVNDGSALDVQADTAYMGELDALTIRNNAAREAWGYQVQANDSMLQASLARSQGITGAAGTLLGGAGSLASMAYSMRGTTARKAR